jgi:hypothetical protein
MLETGKHQGMVSTCGRNVYLNEHINRRERERDACGENT